MRSTAIARAAAGDARERRSRVDRRSPTDQRARMAGASIKLASGRAAALSPGRNHMRSGGQGAIHDGHRAAAGIGSPPCAER